MGYCGCKDDRGLWEKKSNRDALSIEIAVDVLRLRSGIVPIYYYYAKVLFGVSSFLRKYTIESCIACSSWETCTPHLYDGFSRLLEMLQCSHLRVVESSSFPRIPFLFPLMMKYETRLLGLLSEKVEDLSFVKDEESRSALHDLAQVCKMAAPKLDDWRKSMDFLN